MRIDWVVFDEFISPRAALRITGVLTGALLLTSCGKDNVRPQSVEEGCEALCRTPCDTSVPVWRPEDPTDPKAWDSYPEQVTIPLRGKVQQCDLHRTSCVQCLDRLKKEGVTR